MRGASPSKGAPWAAPLAVALGGALFACALALVTSQYRARERFAELEVAQQETKTLEAEGARLRSDLGRVAQPAIVEAVARRLGMRPIDPDHIVALSVAPPSMAGAPPSAGTLADASPTRPDGGTP
jgi:cell division protein FtsL